MSNLKAYIFGSGGHAQVLYSILSLKYEVNFISKDSEDEYFQSPKQFEDDIFFIGIGSNTIRTEIFNKCKKSNLRLGNCIAPNAFIDPSVKIGEGNFIGYSCQILVNSIIGDNIIINTSSVVDHDCAIGDHTQITSGVILGGATSIGQNCFVGISSSILPGISIGDNCNVMAGSLVTKSFEDSFLLGGYPAKTLRRL